MERVCNEWARHEPTFAEILEICVAFLSDGACEWEGKECWRRRSRATRLRF